MLVWVKRGIWLVVALAVVFAVYKGRSLLASSSAKSAAPTIATVPVSTGPVVETVSDPGTIESATSTTVVAEAAGHVNTIAVKVGQVVKQGATLIQLTDDSGLGADVAAAQASLEQAQAQLQADENPAINITQAQIQAAQIAVQQQQLTIQNEENTIAQLTVKAPFAGMVTAVNAIPGQPVSGGQGLVTLVDDSQTWAVIQVAESLLPEIQVGGPASVTIQATGTTLAGTISDIGTTPLGSTGTSATSGTASTTRGSSAASTSTEPTQPVTIVLQNPPSGLIAGESAIATFTPTGPQSGSAGPFTATGVVAYPQTVTVSAQQSGTLASIASVGQQVTAGQTVAVETSTALQEQLKQDQLTLQSDQDNLNNLLHPQPASQTTIQSQQAQVNSLQQQLALRQQAYANLTITAPIAGEITSISVIPGDAVAQGTTVMTMLNPDALQAQVTVDELDISKVKPGQTATVTVNALPNRTFTGKVLQIMPTATVSQGVSTYQVNVSMPNNPQLLTGMSVQAAIQVASVPRATRVPGEAVQNANGHYFVMVPTPTGGQRPQPVQVGVIGDTWTQITSGLTPGQQVVAAAVAASGSATNFRGGGFFLGGGGGGPHGGGPRGGGG